MAVNFKTPSSPARSVFTISNFLGADFTNSPGNVDETRSPNLMNMIRDVPGKVRKSMGYRTVEIFGYQSELPCKVNGYHRIIGYNVPAIYHIGNRIVSINGTTLLDGVADKKSTSFQIEDKLYILTGSQFIVYDGTSVYPVSNRAYVPTLYIAQPPKGGGTQYEDLNLLTPAFKELFLSDGESTDYQLHFGGLDATSVEVKILNENGTWDSKTEGTDFTVDRTLGIIHFSSAPAESPVTGEDNVEILAYRTVEGYANRINRCDIGIMYGVNGAADRLFVSGNSEYRNHDWYSDIYNPTYFPDTSYSTLGSAASAIMGYSIIGGLLATHKDEYDTQQNIIIRSGELVDSKPAFKITNTIQGNGAIAKHSFDYLANEPLFLTRLGVYAVTAQDITGEKYSQNRSFFLNGKLLEEPHLENAFSFVMKDMYWLCVNGVAYILDGLQPVQTDRQMPYSTRQYAGFYRTNIPATCMWEKDGEYYFGTSDGRVCQFYSDKYALESYNDDGQAIECIWETPDLDGKLFYKNKTFRYLAVRLESAVATSINIFAMKRGLWNFIKREESKARYLDFTQFSFSKFSFSSDRTQKLISTKTRIKKVDKVRFRLSNDSLNEPFALYDIALEFIENGNYKG